MKKIRIGIVGYGNLGRGVEQGIAANEDMVLTAIFSRRKAEDLDRPSEASPTVIVDSPSRLTSYRGRIDVLILCGGSKTELPQQTPQLAASFNTVDAFDTHAKMQDYYTAVNRSALEASTTAVIAVGWDPGLFSLNRLLFNAVLPHGRNYTFWGRGLSQGHSEAVRSLPGVKYAAQYTVPSADLLAEVRNAEQPDFDAHTAHEREVYVVPEPDADTARIERAIVTMPDYFAGYETRVRFIPEEEFLAAHTQKPHGGSVIRVGGTSNGHEAVAEFNLRMASNPEFTASVILAYARACARLYEEGIYGAKTIFDIPPSYLSPQSSETLLREYL